MRKTMQSTVGDISNITPEYMTKSLTAQKLVNGFVSNRNMSNNTEMIS
jgi:hypothetical protein